ncbi:MAG TPA: hypothetical protein VLA29_11495 [Acidimicrobiia bacterium]|nr:hypothetical protein [Acidimicrobiia bacterium]
MGAAVIGRVMNRSLDLLGRRWQGFVGPALVVGVIQVAIGLVASLSLDGITDAIIEEEEITLGAAMAFLGSSMVVFSISLVLMAFLVAMVIQAASGDRVDAGAATALIGRRFGVLVGAVLLGVGIVFVGFMLLVVPGIWAAVSLTPLMALVVGGDEGPVRSVRSSFELVRGSWFTVFAIVAIVFAVNIVLGILGGFPGATGLALSVIATAASSLFQAAVVWFTYEELTRRRNWPELA